MLFIRIQLRPLAGGASPKENKGTALNRNTIITLLATLIALWLSVTPRGASASTAGRWLGNDSRNAAMGRGGRAVGDGPGNLQVNPALMSFSPEGLWLSLSSAWNSLANGLHIEQSDRPGGYDVPDIFERTDPEGWNSQQPLATASVSDKRGKTDDLPAVVLVHLAAVGSFGIDGLRLGLAVSAPMPSVIDFKVWYNDEREQYFTNRLHFERFGEFDQVVSITPGISYAPWEWLSIGVSAKVDLGMAIDVGMFVSDVEDLEEASIVPAGKVSPAIRPTVGIALRAPFGLRGGLIYKHESFMKVDMDVDVQISNLGRVFRQKHELVLGYEPSELALAVGYEWGPLVVEIGGAWEMWSSYRDRHGNDWIHPSDPEGLEDWTDPSFDDIFTVHAGAEWRLSSLVALRAGYGYFPSPFPPQTGRYNYVDNDLSLYSLGAGFNFEVFDKRFRVDAAGQFWHMRTLSVNKQAPGSLSEPEGGIIDEVPDGVMDSSTGEPLAQAEGLQTNNPGFPGYKLAGMMLSAMVTVGMEF